MSPITAPVRIDVVSEADATGEVAELYAELRDLFLGMVPDVFKLVSTRPDLLRTFVAGQRSMFDGGVLPREAKEVVAVTVARTASCQFCTSAHDAILRLLDVDPRYADAVVEGRLDDEVIPADIRVLAELARDVTRHAHRITDDDLDRVRALGVDARVGPVPREFCPGEFTVNARGAVKLVGTAQRVVRHASLLAASVAVVGAERLRAVLVDVYAALELDMDPATVGAVAEDVPGVGVDDVARAVVAAYGSVDEGRLEAATLVLASSLEPWHRL
jgi:uncharacterized peroxidase-related enzyme